MIKQAKFIGYEVQKSGIKMMFRVDHDHLSEIEMNQLQGSSGHIAFFVDEIKTETERAMKDISIGMNASGKSKSQILRGLIMEYWMMIDSKVEFDEFYRASMDKLITQIQQKIQEKKK